MRVCAVLLILLILPLASAANLEVEYFIGEQTRVTYTFSNVEEPLTIPLPNDVREVRVGNQTIPATNTIQVHEDSTLEFFTDSLTQRNSFVADLGRISATLEETRVHLPIHARLSRGLNEADPSIRPTPSSATTDGQNIIFVYAPESLEPARAIIIDYETNTNNTATSIALLLAILLVGLLVLLYTRKQTKKETLTKNLFKEEEVLVNLLLKQPTKELWQKELTKQSGLTKVRASRKLRNLEAKGVIEKIPYGNTNKIRLKEE
ncbi:MAG: helix-turn-helix transcriptional regulator [Candidatus Woesearchaeota archaeon]